MHQLNGCLYQVPNPDIVADMIDTDTDVGSEAVRLSTLSTMGKSPLYHSIVKIALRAHIHTISISEVSHTYGIPQLASSICHMLELGNNGTSLQQWEYHIDRLPLSFRFL